MTESEQSESSEAPPNKDLLDKINSHGDWFHAKKTRPIWARQLDRGQVVETLEGHESVPAGNWLCRGEAGDVWPQTEAHLRSKYVPTGELGADGWEQFEPNPDAAGVMAFQVSSDVMVESAWGTLHGKPGDYLVKGFADRDTKYPDDVWIVDKSLFETTYERVDTA